MSIDGIAIVIVIVLLVWLFQVDFTASAAALGKVKNPKAPAISREAKENWGR